MNVNAKIAIGGASALAVGLVGWFIYKKISRPASIETVITSNPVAETQQKESVSNLASNVIDQVVQVTGVAMPRGIRNNNPLNIKYNSANDWVGQTGKDSGGFCVFDEPKNGVRAAARILNSYRKIGLGSIRQIVTRWTSGDSTKIQSNYINHVSSALNIGPDVALNTNNFAALLSAMTYFENGQNPYPMSLFVGGVASAGV